MDLTPELRAELLGSLSERELLALLYDWPTWGRPEQVEPLGDWDVWLIMAGRGWGKTRTGAETVKENVKSGDAKRVALIAPTAADYRDVMVEGESGLLAISEPWFMPEWEPSKRRLTWPNGAIATCYAAETPSRLRGPQHDFYWGDEPAVWKYATETYDNLMFGLRLGRNPRGIMTTTPRPIALIRELVRDPRTVITGGATYDNAVNLSAKALERLRRRYEGTTVGRQELYAELLSEVPGALWKRALIDANRRDPEIGGQIPEMLRIVVAVDPAATSSEESDETGIIVAGLGTDMHGYVLEDCSLRGTPGEWGAAAVAAYHRHRADLVIAETNNGGDMVQYTIATVDPAVPSKAIWASRGKYTRAQPVAALYEQGRVHHLKLPPKVTEGGLVVGALEELEDQLCTWVPIVDKHSPDRLDADVWALTELMLEPEEDGTWEAEDELTISRY